MNSDPRQHFILTCLVLGQCSRVDISEERYVAIKSAKEFIFTLLDIERKFDMLIENYKDFEVFTATLAVLDMIYIDTDYTAFQNDLDQLNRKFINILSSGRTYIETTKHNIKRISEIAQNSDFDCERNFQEQYELHIEYRACEALRNFSLHHSNPIHTLQKNREWQEALPEDKMRFTIVPYLDCETLSADKNFKSSVLADLKKIKNKINILFLLRGYISAISVVHEAIRTHFQQAIVFQENQYLSPIADYKKSSSNSDSTIGLAAVILKDNKYYTDPVEIFPECVELKNSLARKNSHLSNIHKRYVTNTIIN